MLGHARHRRHPTRLWQGRPVDLRDLPRVVWALAAARFVSSAASFTMLFLTLYLTGPRDLADGDGGPARRRGRRRRCSRATSPAAAGATGSATAACCSSRRPSGGLLLTVVPLVPPGLLAVGAPVRGYLLRDRLALAGALSALAVPARRAPYGRRGQPRRLQRRLRPRPAARRAAGGVEL